MPRSTRLSLSVLSRLLSLVVVYIFHSCSHGHLHRTLSPTTPLEDVWSNRRHCITRVRPPSPQVGVPDLEKAFIRSLAEVDADAKAYNNRVRPLLAHIPRPRLFGAVAAAPGVARSDDSGSCGSKKVVPMGHKKTLVLDLDETLVSSSRTPCDCDYKVRAWLGGQEWWYSAPVLLAVVVRLRGGLCFAWLLRGRSGWCLVACRRRQARASPLEMELEGARPTVCGAGEVGDGGGKPYIQHLFVHVHSFLVYFCGVC